MAYDRRDTARPSAPPVRTRSASQTPAARAQAAARQRRNSARLKQLESQRGRLFHLGLLCLVLTAGYALLALFVPALPAYLPLILALLALGVFGQSLLTRAGNARVSPVESLFLLLAVSLLYILQLRLRVDWPGGEPSPGAMRWLTILGPALFLAALLAGRLAGRYLGERLEKRTLRLRR